MRCFLFLQASPQGLFSLNATYCNALAHLCVPGNRDFPWTECFFFHFRAALRSVWTYASTPDNISRDASHPVYPTKLKMGRGKVEMPVTILPRVDKKTCCDVCQAKLPTVTKLSCFVCLKKGI